MDSDLSPLSVYHKIRILTRFGVKNTVRKQFTKAVRKLTVNRTDCIALKQVCFLCEEFLKLTYLCVSIIFLHEIVTSEI